MDNRIEINSRLYLRPIKLVDTKAVHTLIDDSREELKNLVWAESETLQGTHDWINGLQTSTTMRVFCIVSHGKIVGIFQTTKVGTGRVQLGYWLATDYRGHGTMNIVVKHVVNQIADLCAIVAQIKHGNTSSKAILENAGLKPYAHDHEWTYFMRNQNAHA